MSLIPDLAGLSPGEIITAVGTVWFVFDGVPRLLAGLVVNFSDDPRRRADQLKLLAATRRRWWWSR
ncbi:hypothetical protein ACFWPX_33405 [Nocardia sp. NPDC058518]|uniref:hypothetical protein n=1 Tax=Nocardia sp. NPDC058518 TaxID=3346534 RepID=UPI00366351B1